MAPPPFFSIMLEPSCGPKRDLVMFPIQVKKGWIVHFSSFPLGVLLISNMNYRETKSTRILYLAQCEEQAGKNCKML